MDWGTLLPTLVGAVIGVGSTLGADRLRWARELRQRATSSRQELYGQFLTALNEAAESLWVLGLGDRHDSSIDLPEALRAAVHGTGLYSFREQVMIIATDDVLAKADQAVDRVREYRDCLAAGHREGSPDEVAGMDAYKRAVKELRSAMRADLIP
ncbi:hypothetical protein CG723_44110 [Streptomyces sp. CB01635]|uniref:hypothetical protein n=1 Tax=unclassified Streptomyces TaxID=2593676 RepID=UPI000C27EBA9|nr:hypothetical protein [Streptomyces sp. CB01635]PJN05587.1 hypothetical protein CG723_44110 [Streptomyces sp. CB01635]